ncbi:ATPase family AAA domain-containing protein 2-like isoform X2 [Rhynchophorus ferrugineus]|uniref:ATPase family AAA domain-containing protein 2-like isoform X2 n=1 Tax=Rhynchophorus ferrugineus TaxID=354439 RepID=UPI003FCCA22E
MSLQNQNQSQNHPTYRLPKRTKQNAIDFCKIGGLSHHIATLREIIIIPLLHGNVFAHFNIKAPRGVLFYGPPGKTLVAAALATELNREGIGKVSFFERKGADILDKWVGGSEKNLRDLFEKATKSRPSIIFFDEIDGLAPIRDKQTDHIHTSVVATLLALMDGLDNKPGLIVVGATNRIEAVDPALRRPGRFDKELYFPLPGTSARREILEVHTASWKHKPNAKVLATLVESTSGYSGADLQALCSEAVVICMKRTYPTLSKAKINPESIKIQDCDFLSAKLNFVPTSLKTGCAMRKLSSTVQPLLQGQLRNIMKSIKTVWPHFLKEDHRYLSGEGRYAGKVILVGNNKQGLNDHLIPAILQQLEYLPAFVYDITKTYKNIENIQYHFPSVIVLSKIDEWWDVVDDCEQLSIVSSLENIHAGVPVLVMATCKTDVPCKLQNFFYNNSSILIKIENPKEYERKAFFKPLFFNRNIVSLSSVLENARKAEEKPSVKLRPSKREIQILRRSRRNGKSLGNILGKSGKRKREGSGYSGTRKRLKTMESQNNLVKSNSTSSIYDIHKEIKREKFQEPRKCDSLSSITGTEQKHYFTNIFTNLLESRNLKCSASIPHIKTSNTALCKHFRAEDKTNVPEDSFIVDNQMQQIYHLWIHTSVVTSENMTVAQLELLYDVISACINIHWNSFELLTKNLEIILHNIEKSYDMDKVE